MNPLLLTDGYKTGHAQMYPTNTTLVYSNLTPRSLKYAPSYLKKIVVFGSQYVARFIHSAFEDDFFSKPKDEVCQEIKKEFSMYLGVDYDVAYFEKLHDLGYLPIKIKSLSEGTLVNAGIPVLTIQNTLSEFYWLTNYLETLISNLMWKPMTSASIAYAYRNLLSKWAQRTAMEEDMWFLDFQGHDFSMRGMDNPLAAGMSGLGHAISFTGSDTLPTIHCARKYYDHEGVVIMSVNATEHAVMSAGTKEDEIETFRRLLKTFPTGILSVVSDTWDLWHVITNILPELKNEIMARDGKLVIRPDSGTPEDILCGPEVKFLSHGVYVGDERTYKGVIQLLWEIFGGAINEKGYKVLDNHIGAIYGDSITLDRADVICQRLESMGFATTNVVLGIGSFTYQYNTRDTLGLAMKATYCVVDGEPRIIYKDPITDDGTKKSAKGLLYVQKNESSGEYELIDNVDIDTENKGELRPIYEDGEFYNVTTLTDIRTKLKNV